MALRRPHVRADDAADPAERRAAHRQGRRLVDHLPRAADADAPGAERHDPDGAAVRHPVRPRPAVGRPRVRRAAGVRRQHLPPDAADRAARRRSRPRRPPTKRSSRCRTPTRPTARSPSTPSRRAPKATSSRASSSRTSRTASSTCATSRRAAAGATCSSPTRRSRIGRRSTSRGRAGSRSIAPSARSSWCSRTAPCTRPIPNKPEAYDGEHLRAPGARHGRRSGVPADADHQGRQREIDRRAAPDRGRERRARRDQLQPALHDPAEVLAAGRLPRPRR